MDQWITYNAERYWLKDGGPLSKTGADVIIIDDPQMPGLIPLIKQCPRLHTLRLQLDLAPVAIPLLGGVSNTHIKKISAKPGSTLVRPQQVFRSLITLFPNLTDVGEGQPDKGYS